jgi:tRNA (guanine37-N1)-methyltransferase
MLIKAEPIALSLEWLGYDVADESQAVIITDPAAPLFKQSDARELATKSRIAFLCGHYEGIDHRIRETKCTHSFSIGDYVLTNGELAACVMADAIVRLLPGVLGNEGSLDADSFSNSGLSAPNYTKPENWRGHPVPPVLMSGNHAQIAKWRAEMAREFTEKYRPDLLPKSAGS